MDSLNRFNDTQQYRAHRSSYRKPSTGGTHPEHHIGHLVTGCRKYSFAILFGYGQTPGQSVIYPFNTFIHTLQDQLVFNVHKAVKRNGFFYQAILGGMESFGIEIDQKVPGYPDCRITLWAG